MSKEIEVSSSESPDHQERQKRINEWSKLYGREISEDEYKDICTNLDNFFSILKEWNDEDKTTNSK